MQFNMAFTPELKARLEDWRRRQDKIPSTREAIRRLLEAALQADSAKGAV